MLMPTPSKNIGRGRTPTGNPKVKMGEVRALKVTERGQIRPLTYVNRKGDVRRAHHQLEPLQLFQVHRLQVHLFFAVSLG
jgi:hypothetical protein